MKLISSICRLVWLVGTCFVAFVLLLKVHWLNNPHCTLREDPLEQWIAIGIAYLLIWQAARRGT